MFTMLFIFVVGLALGSFINAYVWRVHQQSIVKSKKKLQDLSVVQGRSMCPHCEHRLATKDLIPVLSWVSLKGRCRYCSKPISVQYPLVELINGMLFVGFYLFWPQGFSAWGLVAFCLWLFTATVLNALFVYDLKWMILPDKMVLPFTITALLLVFVVYVVVRGDIGAFINALVAGVLLFSVFYIIFQISNEKWMGGGDVKIAFGLGLLAGGILEVLLLLFIASLVGSVISLPMLLRRKNRKEQLKLPFGPLLISASYVVFFFGAALGNAYLSLIGF